MIIYFDDEQDVKPKINELMEKSASRCLLLEGVDESRCEVSVTFVDEETIRNLNSQYRDVDKVTDVLSFPQYDCVGDFPAEGEISLGDVVICPQRAGEQAEEFGHSFDREIIYLFTHSILHLLGYDHMEETEKRLMRSREEEVMSFLNLRREEND